MNIKEVQDRSFEVLCIIDDICKKEGIPYFLDGGTELGAVREKDIIAWSKHHNLEFIQCACKFSEAASEDESKSMRLYTKNLIKALKKEIPQVEQNIFKSASNVTLDMILGYRKYGELHSFLDEYNEKEPKQ